MGRSNNSTRLIIDGDLLYKSRDVQRLDLKWKAAWIYVLLTSDSSGFWEPEFDILGLRIGAGVEGIKEEEAVKVFKGMYDELPSGVWFIPSRIQHANKHGISTSENQIWIYRNWVEQGVNVDKYSHLLKQSKEEFIEALKERGKYPSPVYNPESKENVPNRYRTASEPRANLNVNVNDNVTVNAFEIVNENDSAESENNSEIKEPEKKKISENFFQYENGKPGWVISNYPHGQIYTEKEQGEIKKLVDTWELEIGFEKICENVLDQKTLIPKMVKPLIRFLVDGLTASRKEKDLNEPRFQPKQ